MKLAITMLACALSLSGCGKSASQAQDVVRTNLKDPDSAKFGELLTSADGKKGCLSVNAKNSMGGYSGDQQAHLQDSGGRWEFQEIREENADGCKMTWLSEDGGMMSNNADAQSTP